MRPFRIFIGILACAAVFYRPALALEPGIPDRFIEAKDVAGIQFLRRLSGRDWPSTTGNIRQKIVNFYAGRNNKPVWTSASGLTPRAKRVIAEIQKAGQWGLRATDYDVPNPNIDLTDSEARFEAEIQLSVAVLKYARDARGGRYDPKRLSIYIDRTPTFLPADIVLTTLERSPNVETALQGFHPQHPQFERLRKLYLKLRSTSVEDFNRNREDAERADEDAPDATSKKRRRQKSKKKNRRKDPRKLAQRVLYNMEMWRWMPPKLGNYYIQSNVPEFKFRIVKSDRVIHEERLITGKVKNQTSIFSDEMETVVFHPFWGVPNSIKVKELLPGLLNGRDTLAKNGLRMKYRGREVEPFEVDWTSTDIRNFHVYQPPGTKNALGVVKFLFPNAHQIYMHDTPTKHLFKRSVRAYSHGCMRVRNPVRFAEILLANDKGWGPDKIASIIRDGPENNNVRLSKKVPVHVTYFTVTVDKNGKAKYFRDIYGHEKRIKLGLEGKAHTIVLKKQNLDKLVNASLRRPADDDDHPSFFSRSRRTDPNWARNIFGLD